jgi:hypothetical protein
LCLRRGRTIIGLMNVVALIVAITAALAAAMSAWYARNQVGEMKRQVEETRHEFELSGPYLKISIRYEGKASGGPLMVDLANNGRQEAHIMDLIVRPYQQGFLVPGGFVQLPDPLLGPKPPLVIPPDNGVTWTFPWPWVTAQAKRRNFDAVRFEVIRGNGTIIVSDPVPTTYAPFQAASISTPKQGMDERKRLDQIIGPAIKMGRDAEVNPVAGSSSPTELGEKGADE